MSTFRITNNTFTMRGNTLYTEVHHPEIGQDGNIVVPADWTREQVAEFRRRNDISGAEWVSDADLAARFAAFQNDIAAMRARVLEPRPHVGQVDYVALRKATTARFAKTLAHLAK